MTSLGSDALTSAGHIRVKPNLELPDYPHVFALGDAIDWNESKQVVSVLAQIPIVLANIKSILNAKAPAKEYKGATVAMLVSNGRVSLGPYLTPRIWSDYACSTAGCSTWAFFGDSHLGTGLRAGSKVGRFSLRRPGKDSARSPELRSRADPSVLPSTGCFRYPARVHCFRSSLQLYYSNELIALDVSFELNPLSHLCRVATSCRRTDHTATIRPSLDKGMPTRKNKFYSQSWFLRGCHL